MTIAILIGSVSVSDPDLDWIQIQGSSGFRGLLDLDLESGSRCLKRTKMLNNHNIVLLFSDFYNILLLFGDFYNILSFTRLLSMSKSYNHEVIKKKFRFLPGFGS